MPNDIEQILKVAVEHHQAGQFDAAAQGYEQILASDPNHSDALHLAGCLRYQKDDRDAGRIIVARQEIAPLEDGQPEHGQEIGSDGVIAREALAMRIGAPGVRRHDKEKEPPRRGLFPWVAESGNAPDQLAAKQ